MMKMGLFVVAAGALALGSPAAWAGGEHGKAGKKTIVETASANADFETLVAALKAADLVDTLSGKGPFTVFAPTDAAFAKLPDGTVETLVKPENKAALTGILTYHVVPGRVTSGQIQSLAAQNGGIAVLKTVQGGELKVRNVDGKFVIEDGKGGTSTITDANLNQTNGTIHVIDAVLMPS